MRLVLCCAVVGAVRRRADCTPATCVGDDDANYDRDFFGDARVVRSFDDERRYLTVVGLGASGLALAARRGAAPSADGPGTYVHVETGCDDAFTCTDTKTTLFRGQSAAHNLALWRDADGLYALGGLGNAKQGLALRGPVAPTPEGLASLGGAPTTATLLGSHASCVDRRPRTGTFCEFDGRVSMVRISDKVVAYARSNLIRNKTSDGGFGGRHVQAAILESSATFGPFASINIADYETCVKPGDNIYYGAVMANPVDPSTALGLFPVVHNTPGGDDAFVGLALTCDGVSFSPLKRLLNSTPSSLGRSTDHPVLGLVAKTDKVFFYVHRGVHGVFDDDKEIERLPPSRVVRYAVSLDRLRAYTASMKAALPTCLHKKSTQLIDPHKCWLGCARSTRDRSQNWNDAIVDACVAACERRSPSTCGRLRLVGVGAKKTGTTSLSAVCRLLGLREMGLRAKARVLDEGLHRRALRGDAKQFVDALAPYECFQDSPFTDPELIPVIARHFPDAKFILTTRSPDVWAASALRWTQLRSRAYAPYSDHFWAAMGFRGTPSRNEAAGLLVKHDSRVRALTDVLELDFATERSETFWPKVCAFVHVSSCPSHEPVPRVVPKGGARDGQPS